MIKLTIFPSALNLKSGSPFSIKAELFLKLAKVDYEVKTGGNPASSPNGKFPLIEDAGKIIADSHYIYDHLCKNYELNLDHHLNDMQKSIGHAFTRLAEDHLYWVMVYSRWIDEDYNAAVDDLLSGVPAHARFFVKRIIKKQVAKNLYGQGISRHSKTQIYQKGVNDINAIIQQLEQHDYFLADEISSYDAIIYAILSCFYYPSYQTEMHKLVTKNQSVIDYLARVEKHAGYAHS